MTDAILDDLAARGLIHDHTDLDALRERLAQGVTTVYAGFDPTAESLHIGNLVPLLVLRRFQDAGHRPIALAGGATGMIGDPSGRSDERALLDDATLDAHLAGITPQLARLLDFSAGPTQATLVDNREWTSPMSALEFLRDVGKHVTVNAMLAKESVRSRLEGEAGISYTEFSYMLLQANDFCWLHEHRDCEVQLGGSDQWGNITAGIDLIRRRRGARAHGLTFPLIMRADGAKFGKTAGGAVWLSAERTSPYAFYQYWINVDDRDAERFLLQLTLLPVTTVHEIMAAHAEAPHLREAQRRLAHEVTVLVHGEEAAGDAASASRLLFGGDPAEAAEASFAMLELELPTGPLAAADLATGMAAVDLAVATGLVTSRSDAGRALTAGELHVNGRRLEPGAEVSSADLLHDRYLLVRRGKKRYELLVVG
ncbi:MAG: tyrosine--tRNA ligase [Acidimicrobiales bacterium]